MRIVKFNDVDIKIEDNNLLSTLDVATGYGVSDSTIRRHLQLHSDELLEGIHYINKTSQRGTKKLMWTLEGVHMLGFFIKSERAKEFRKFTAKLLTEIKKGNVQVSATQPPAGCPADKFDSRINGYKGMLARKNKEIERLEYELAFAKDERKRAIEAAKYFDELYKKEKKSKHQGIILEHNILDLAGSYARMREELLGVAESLEYLSKSVKGRIETVDHFIKAIEKYLPKSKNVVETATKHAKTNRQWIESAVIKVKK